MKIAKLLQEIINEGVSVTPAGDKSKVRITSNNSSGDLLNTVNGFQTIGEATILYTLEYNQTQKDGAKIKKAADLVKYMESDVVSNIPELTKDIEEIVSKTVPIAVSKQNFKPGTICYLDSKGGLSETVANVIAKALKVDSEDIFQLSKIQFPSYQDMLIPDVQKQVDTSLYERLLAAAKEIWEKNDGKIRSTGMETRLRHYFKNKYDLDSLLEKKNILFVDDNFQTGTDFKSIASFCEARRINSLFYALIKLPKESSVKTQDQVLASKKILDVKTYTPGDFKKIAGELYVKAGTKSSEELYNKKQHTKTGVTMAGNTYYKLKSSNVSTIRDSNGKIYNV